MFTEATFRDVIPWICVLLIFAWGGIFQVFGHWPKWQKNLQEREQQRKEHQQKLETLLTEIRDLLRQKS